MELRSSTKDSSKESGILKWSRSLQRKKTQSDNDVTPSESLGSVTEQSTPPPEQSGTSAPIELKADLAQDEPKKADPTDNEKETPKILYRVEYQDSSKNVIRRQAISQPLSTKREVAPRAVLELTTTITESSSTRTDVKDKSSSSDSKSESETKDGKSVEPTTVPDGMFVTKYSLTINSPYIMNALRSLVMYYPDASLAEDTLTIDAPFRLLTLYIDELRQYRANSEDSHSKEYKQRSDEDLDILLDFFDESEIVRPVREELARHQGDTPTCRYDHLWTLFKAGEMCYTREKGRLSGPYVVRWTTVTQSTPDLPVTEFSVSLWNLQFNGDVIQRIHRDWDVEPFSDGAHERRIESLDIIPAKYCKDPQFSKERLIERGKMYWQLAKECPAYREYNGKTLSSEPEELHGQRGRVIIDPKSGFHDYDGSVYIWKYDNNPTGCLCDSCKSGPPPPRMFAGYDNCDPTLDNPPDEEQFYMLCDEKVWGTTLKDAKHHALAIDHISNIDVKESSFNQLVLPSEVKATVRALTASIERDRKKANDLHADFIKGKGEGKIILLHGPPGVGKTATAEAISDLTRKPLLPLTCGDLGVTADQVEKKLQKYLAWGERWDAIVLLDEADIYLQARDLHDVKRNSLVSVFLRELEYYKGLLMITTNRIKTFDEAFISRVHVSLYYPRLEDDDREKIWANHFKRLEGTAVKIDDEAKQFLLEDSSVKELKWNGREIRNAFSTAVSLAEYAAQRSEAAKSIITLGDVQRVVNLSNGFKRYLKKLNNNRDEEYLAKAKGLRNDGFQHTA